MTGIVNKSENCAKHVPFRILMVIVKFIEIEMNASSNYSLDTASVVL